MATRRGKRTQGFLKDFKLSDQYLLPPEPSTGRPGLLEGVVDGINVLIKLWPRKRKQNDEDLAEIWRHELRQLHRLAGYPGAGDRIATLYSSGQDADGFYLVLDPGQRRPIGTLLQTAPATHWLKAPRIQAKRLRLWLNLSRIVFALETLHAQGLMHRNIDSWAILTSGAEEPDFLLTGFEWSMRLSAGDQAASKRRDKRVAAPRFDSFLSDWAALGTLTASLLEVNIDRLSDLSIPASEVADHLDTTEVRLVRQLLGIERLDRIDGDVIGVAIGEITRRLEAGIAQQDAQYRLVVRLGYKSKLTQDIREASHVEVDADDIDAQLRFIRDDLAAQALLIAVTVPGQPGAIRFTLRGHELGYRVEPYRPPFGQDPTWDFAYCEVAESQPPIAKHTIGDPISLEPAALMVMTTAEASEVFSRVRKRVASWDVLRATVVQPTEAPSRERQLLSAFALSQLVEMSFAVSDIVPISILARPTEKETDAQYFIRVAVRQDRDREQLAKALKLKGSTERFEQMLNVDNFGEEGGWTLTDTPTLGDRAHGETEWRFVRGDEQDGQAAFIFAGKEPAPPNNEVYLVPSGSVGTIRQFKRRIKALEALAEHQELLHMLTDARGRLVDSQDRLDHTDSFFTGLDSAKQQALRDLTAILPLYLIQGPPGVGKTHLVGEVVRRRFSEDPTSRLLLTAQSHAAIDHLMSALKPLLEPNGQAHVKPLVVRCRKKDKVGNVDPFDISRQASTLLHGLVASPLFKEGTIALQSRLKAIAKDANGGAAKKQTEGQPSQRIQSGRGSFESVVLRAANVVFATTGAPELEKLIEERGQFDWSIVEEAGKATGGELVSPLLLSHRRLMIGDHKQLPPYRSDEMRVLLESAAAMQEVVRVAPTLISRSLRGTAVDDLLDNWQDNDVADVGGAAIDALLMFETMIEREFDHQRKRPNSRRIAHSLTVQHRMHPEIAALVSHTFYEGTLTTDPEREARFAQEPPPFDIVPKSALPNTPIVVVTMPDIQSQLHKKRGDLAPPWWNEDEVAVVLDVLAALLPKVTCGRKPTLAVLSPYAQQVKKLHQDIESLRASRLAHLSDFATANGGTSFCSTVDGFQGSEADIVVVSLVRNNQFTKPSLALGFLRDLRRMNVLLSRARWKLILVGSLDFLRSVIAALPDDPGPKYRFLKTLIQRLDDGIAANNIGTVPSAILKTAKEN